MYVLSSANEARFVGQRLLSIKPCWLDLIIFLAYNSLWIQSCISFAVTLPRTNISGECYTANSALAHQFILSKPLLFFSYPVTYWIWPYFSLFCHHLRVIAKCSYITVGVCNQYFLRMSLSWVMVDSLLMHGLWIHYWICFPVGYYREIATPFVCSASDGILNKCPWYSHKKQQLSSSCS